MCKMHGVRFIERIKIFESMFKPKSTVVPKQNTTKFSALIIIIIDLKLLITISVVIRNSEQKMHRLSLYIL